MIRDCRGSPAPMIVLAIEYRLCLESQYPDYSEGMKRCLNLAPTNQQPVMNEFDYGSRS